MLRRTFIVTAVAAFSLPAKPVFAVDAETLDIGGAKLGMSPENTTAALNKNGWKGGGGGYAELNFEAQVRMAAKLRPISYKTVSVGIFFEKGKERIMASFVTLPKSGELYSLKYTNEDPAIAYDEFVQRAVQRYGKPDAKNIQDYSQSFGWGAFGKDHGKLGPYLIVHTSKGGAGKELLLEDNGLRAKRKELEIAKAVELLPKPKPKMTF